MSQHVFHTLHQGIPVCVYIGFDRPIGHFFMVIEKVVTSSLSDDDQNVGGNLDDSIVYSNLYEKDAFGKTLEFYKQKLHELGIEVPEQMFIESLEDKKNNVGNRHVDHTPIEA